MRTLLSQPAGNNWASFRDKVILSVLYDTGARVQELVDLKISNVRLENPAVITLHGKGNKTRQVPIMQSTIKLLQSYLSSYKGNPGISRGDNPLFVNQRKQSLSRWGISHIINKYVLKAQAGNELLVGFSITPHIFRHSKAVHMLQAGINLIYIRDFLGHIDCSTTEIYARADTEMKRKAIESSCEDIFPKENLQDWNENDDLMSFLESLR
jgi:site-specific recombinase XerD